MTDWQVVELDGVVPTPWRNGGGTTQVLLTWPHAEGWRVRISVAEIAQDGEFSRYPGAERWFAVLEGAGVQLQVGGGSQLLRADSDPLRFAGHAEVDCKLMVGPTRDLNLMCLPGAGRMRRVDDGYTGVVPARTLVAGYAPGGGTIAVYDESLLHVAPRTLVWRLLEQEGPVAMEGAQALLMEVKL